ncbi:MAG: septum formation initiator family protein [Rhodospirillales bacterium]|nr:septum formation initiator family protein [Rhodospirillales bacterium]
MGLLREIRARAQYAMSPLIGLGIVSYFAYHAVQGERGIIAWSQLKQNVAEARAVQSEITYERNVWERRVRLLHPESLDSDMLEERVRVMLNYGRDDEVIIVVQER